MKKVIAVALATAVVTGVAGTESSARLVVTSQSASDGIITSIGGQDIPGGFSTDAIKGVKVTPKKKKMIVKWKKVSGASGYEVEYSTKKSFRGAAQKRSKSAKATISKLKSNKKYYVRVRGYVEANGVSTCGSWSAVKKCKVK